ncbi:MAG: FtsQ-type POTRA domain-containing protein [Deltaproteobacteria bacterium]|nr:FtsQ-type POTRA domain-containing protein [Deltaproteobacteria bacterium]
MRINVRKKRDLYYRARLRLVKGFFIRNFVYFSMVVFVVIAGFGTLKLYKFVRTNEYFAVKRINVFGIKNAYSEDIIGLSGISIGDNIFSFSSDMVAEQIKSHPWVKKVIVKKHLPDRVSIEVVEYRPVIFINFSQLYLVDENAVVFKRLEANELFDFPIISGISKEDYLSKTEFFRQKIMTIFDIASKFERLFPHISISEIVLEKNGDITIISTKNSFEIRLGQGDYEKKLSILEVMLSHMKSLSINPEIVYLDINREGIYMMKTKQRR